MEESPQQIIRNMRSVGIDLQKWIDKKLLQFSARRPSLFGLETHLATMYRDVSDFNPAGVVMDPMSALLTDRMRPRVPPSAYPPYPCAAPR
jgi:circadian clock protein KaiC